LQGLGGGALMPVGMAMALELFPAEKRGKAMATWGISAMAAPAIGPTIGGWLVTSVSWHWMFLINVPIGVGALIAGLRLLPVGGHRERRPFDLPGLLLGGTGLAVTVLAVMQANTWGWSSTKTLLCLAVGLGSLAAFVHHELHRTSPLIELRMFSQRSFRLAIGAMAFVSISQYARLVFVPLQLESLRGFSALRVGVLFFPAAVASAIGMSIGGRLVDTIGARRPIAIGCAGMFVAMVMFSQLSLTSPVWVITALMSFQGFGWGLTTSPTMVAGMGELPPNLLAQGTAVRSLAQQVSAAMSVAVLGAVVSIRLGTDVSPSHAQSAYNATFLVGALGTVVAFFLALRLPDRVEGHLDDAAAMALHLE